MDVLNLDAVPAFTTKDGSEIRELLAYRNSAIRNQSLAEARVPVGGSTMEHYHAKSEEIYYITHGTGRMRIEAEERGQAEAIARNLYEMAALKVPVICVIIGEGASGGAIGIGVGDRILMAENAWYSVISPESCSSILWRSWNFKEQAAEAAKAVKPIMPSSEGSGEATWEDLVPVDTLGLEVGYRLITLVDKNREGDLLSRIKGVRRKFAQEVGFLPPPVHIRDNLELRPSQYRISLRGAVVGEAEAFPGMWLAINPGHATQKLIGTPTTDPAFGLPAFWIEERQKEMAQMSGYRR